MKRYFIQAALLGASSTLLTGCELIGDIFKAGMYWGIFLVIALVILIVWLVRKARR